MGGSGLPKEGFEALGGQRSTRSHDGAVADDGLAEAQSVVGGRRRHQQHMTIVQIPGLQVKSLGGVRPLCFPLFLSSLFPLFLNPLFSP